MTLATNQPARGEAAVYDSATFGDRERLLIPGAVAHSDDPPIA